MSKQQLYRGLSDAEVLKSRELYGSNVLTPPKKVSAWRLFGEKFTDPLIVILLVIGFFAIGVSAYEYWGIGKGFSAFVEPAGIFVAIFLATGLSFRFELKAQKDFSILNQENDKEKVIVRRNGKATEIPKCDIVVGDILVLQSGQEVPADATLLRAISLLVDESSLTGEPAHNKSVELDSAEDTTYPSNKIYRGTYIMEGHGYAEVTSVGDNTENGRIMQSLMGVEIDDSDNIQEAELNETQKKAVKLQERNRVTRKVKTPLNEQLDRLGSLIANISYIFAGIVIIGRMLVYFHWDKTALMFLLLFLLPLIVILLLLVLKKFKSFKRWECILTIVCFFVLFIGIIFICNHFFTDNSFTKLIAYSLETLMIAVTLVVVSVPEGLPMAVSLALANSMRKMLKTNNLVRKMHACETMGACTVICTDKTGTLTQNRMEVKASLLEENEIMYECMAVNSTAALDLSGDTPKTIGNPTEGALLLWLHNKGLDYISYRESSAILKEVPFSTELKYMATVVSSGVMEGKKILYVKGAPEIVMSMSKDFKSHTRISYEQELSNYQHQAMRTLGFAYKVIDEQDNVIKDGRVIANDLHFLGVVGIEDPVREDVKDSIDQCVNAGIEVKIITGDTMATAIEIGKQIGIWDKSCNEINVIDGPDFSKLSDEELLERVEALKIISRARPMDKKRLVEALQKKNHVVALTGDGTNDAPALNAAHVGLSMGSGTNVAKEASDITIIDNSFASIARAVKWGRSLFMNIQRFLLYQLTVNVAACLLVICGSFMGTRSPLTVTQMLWVNLIMDTFAAFALSGLPPSDKVMKDKPRDRKAFILDKKTLYNILGVGLLFFVISLGFLYIFQRHNVNSLADITTILKQPSKKPYIGDYEQTLLFTIFVMTHFWYLFNARAFKTGGSGFNLKQCDSFITIAVIVLIGQVLITELPGLNSFFNAVPLKLKDWIIIFLASFMVVFIREIFSGIKRVIRHK